MNKREQQRRETRERIVEAAEAARTMVRELYGLDPGARSPASVIHVYPGESSYARAEARLTRGRFRANLGFAHRRTRTAQSL